MFRSSNSGESVPVCRIAVFWAAIHGEKVAVFFCAVRACVRVELVDPGP